MILSDTRIMQAVEEGRIELDPMQPGQLNPASYDLTLAPELLVPEFTPWVAARNKGLHLQPLNLRDVPDQPDYLQPFTMGNDRAYIIEPGEFILGSTVEHVTLPDSIAARVEGKSSLARVGLAVHVTGGFIDPGFEGNITLEMVNLLHRPLMLYPRMRVAQIAFIPVNGEVRSTYGKVGHYQRQAGPTLSRYRIGG